MTTLELFKKYAELCSFEEGPAEYLIDKESFVEALKEFASYHLVEMLDLCVKNHVIGTSEFIFSQGKQYIKELK